MTACKAIVMIGASGAVGGQVVAALAARDDLARLTLLNRRVIALRADARITQHLVNLEDPDSYTALLKDHDTAICTLGVGQPSKTSKAVFIHIDHDMPLAFARACRSAGIEHFSLLSSIGVDAESRSFFLRSKGQLERSLNQLGFAWLSLFHPSVILTPSNRYGISQALTLAAWPWISRVLIGPLCKARGIDVARLGRAIAMNALGTGKGRQLIEWDGFMALQSQPPQMPPLLSPLSETEITRRMPLWVALGDFCLDTQFDDIVPYVVRVAKEGRFSLHEVEHIMLWEVRPALYWNLLSVAGEWAMWDPDWLRGQILETMARQPPPLSSGTSFMPDEWPEIRAALSV